jgi:hypothetical protein
MRAAAVRRRRRLVAIAALPAQYRTRAVSESTREILQITTFHQLVISTVFDIATGRSRFFALGIFAPGGSTVAVAGARLKHYRFVAPSAAPTRMIAGVLINERRLLEASNAKAPLDEASRQRAWAPKRRKKKTAAEQAKWRKAAKLKKLAAA